jgi:hypothetical protein
MLKSKDTECKKIVKLKITPRNWENLKGFTKLLQVQLSHYWCMLTDALQIADDAQQVFSSSCYPNLSAALPALEQLHYHWSTQLKNPAYSRYHDALEAGLAVVDMYYERTADCDAFIMAMGMPLLIYTFCIFTSTLVLDPEQKFNWIETNWNDDMAKQAEEHVKRIVSFAFYTVFYTALQ